jgi:hypothetical protein
MGMTSITRCYASWIACFALLFAALAPSISHAVEAWHGGVATWAEICTADGAKLVNTGDATPSSSDGAKLLHLEHCAFCVTHAGADGPPPSASFVLPIVSGVSIAPTLFYQSPRPLFIWTSAQSRAPPSLS